MNDGPVLQLFTTCVTRLIGVPQRAVGIEVTAWECQVAHLQASKIERVRNASGSDGCRLSRSKESPVSLVGRSVCSYHTESREGWCGVFWLELSLLNEADANAVIVESESELMLFCR